MSKWLKTGSWLALAGAWWPVAARAALELNMPRGVTPYAHEVYELHMLVFWICVAIGVVVFAVMIYSMIVHRKSKGAEPAKFTHHGKLEALWTTVPFLILIAMAVPATKTLIKMERTAGYDMTVKITGYQWLWQYEYVGEGVSFYSRLADASNRARHLDSGIDPFTVEHYLLDVDNPLVLPVDTKVRFMITAGDVIHSWWVPALGWKRDAIPGYINEAWTFITEPGIYRGQCAELCGKDHGFMPIVVKAMSKPDYQRWLTQQRIASASQPASQTPEAPLAKIAIATEPGSDQVPAPDPVQAEPVTLAQASPAAAGNEWTFERLMQQGEQVYTRVCLACHQANGQGLPPAFPSIVGSPIVTGPINEHIDQIIHGVPGTAMQAFGELGLLTPEEIAAVVTYERNAWGQNSGDRVQPSEVKARMGKK